MRSFANDVGFTEVRFVSLPFLAQVFNELKRKQIPCKVLLGTHGALKSKGFLCKAGSYMIVNTAKDFGVQVITFVEETKFLVNGESEEEVADSEKLFSSAKMCKRHPEMIDTMCLTSEIDFVPNELLIPKELVDLVLTEKGAFPPDAVPIPDDRSGLVSEKKESNLT
jgi:translation initiation factor 2B subunit (eIF-2B alpha/beta/delta family)